MSVRVRGEHQQPYMHRWRLKRPGGRERSSGGGAHESEAGGGVQARARASRFRRAGLAVVVMFAMLGAAAVGYRARPIPAAPDPSPYPPTPRAWFDSYMAAAVDNPVRVCSVLFTPELAATYGRTPQRSCGAYFRRASDSAVEIVGIRAYEHTAVVSLRERLAPRDDWAVVLDRVDRGWRAVDLLSGR
jgi:hypothetical protein